MSNNPFEKKSLYAWQQTHPLLKQISRKEPLFWVNNEYRQQAEKASELTFSDIEDASDRLQRFASYMCCVFPETQQSNGIIESPLVEINAMQTALAQMKPPKLPGKLLLKCDSHLPISGSVKARGGIYEIIKLAESIALEAGLLQLTDDYEQLNSAPFKALFAKHSVSVGSTGNLGLSIGIMSAQLGFNVTVHMSADARAWKKQLLRDKGVIVIEYKEDYSKAVEEGRLQAQRTENCHFVDDENSKDLFLGYAVAALRLEKQLADQQIKIDAQHPLFVYLPCGVGGAPGGIAFGLKQVFGEHVHCFFAEPTSAPCMLLGMYTNLHDQICVQDIGIDGITCADGLAVGRPSAFVGRFMQNMLSGVYTITDDQLYQLLALMKDSENIELEPSALAGVVGMRGLFSAQTPYIEQQGLSGVMQNATHIAWATGGSMVPKEEREQYYQQGVELLKKRE
jgi:D-serine dehydratase